MSEPARAVVIPFVARRLEALRDLAGDPALIVTLADSIEFVQAAKARLEFKAKIQTLRDAADDLDAVIRTMVERSGKLSLHAGGYVATLKPQVVRRCRCCALPAEVCGSVKAGLPTEFYEVEVDRSLTVAKVEK